MFCGLWSKRIGSGPPGLRQAPVQQFSCSSGPAPPRAFRRYIKAADVISGLHRYIRPVSRRPTTLTTERNPGQSFPVLRYSNRTGGPSIPAVQCARALESGGVVMGHSVKARLPAPANRSHILVQPALILFDRQQVVGSPVQNPLGNLLLAPHGINGECNPAAARYFVGPAQGAEAGCLPARLSWERRTASPHAQFHSMALSHDTAVLIPLGKSGTIPP